jgi:photosystem II stability/assembly factor-like uncharacterized protein
MERPATESSASWELIGPRQGGTVSVIAVSPRFAKDRTVFAGTLAGLYRSTDGGENWEPSGSGLNSPFVDAIAISPKYEQDHMVLVGTRQGGLFRSADSGESWFPVEFWSQGSSVTAIALSPSFESDGLALAGTEGAGVLRSTNRGRTWNPSNFGLLDMSVLALAVSPNFGEDQTIFVATGSGVYRSPNAGRAWRIVNLADEEYAVQSLAMSPNFGADKTIFAGTEGNGIFRSTNGGAAWTVVNEGLTDLSVNWIVVSAKFASDRTVYAATSDGVHRSTDGGTTWQKLTGVSALTLAAAPATDPAVLFAGQAQGGVAISRDAGATWTTANEGLSGRLIVGLWITPSFASDQSMYTTSLDQGVERSIDGGRSWQALNEGLPTLQIPALALSPRFETDRTLFAACANGLFWSADGAESWTIVSSELDGVDVRSIAAGADHDNGRTLFVGTSDNRILRSRDDGNSWQPLRQQIAANEEIVTLACSPGFVDDQVLFVGTYTIDQRDGSGVAGVWRGDAGGDSLVCQTTFRTNNRWVAFGIPTTFTGTGMFFAGVHNAVLRPMQPSVSAEGFSRRRVWKAEPVAPVTGSVVALAVSRDYGSDRTIFAATSHGVFKSATGGLSWKQVGEGLRQKSTVAIALSPIFPSDRQVFALSLGGDLWRFIDA